MNYPSEQWAKMRWNINTLQAPLLTTYTDLNDLFTGLDKEFHKCELDKETLIKYIILVYHKKSPFVSNVADVIDRKVQVLAYLGVKRNKDGKFPPEIDDLIFVRNEALAYITIHFIKYENDRMWAKYCVNSELYWRAMFLTMKEGDTSGSKGADEILKIQLENKKKLSDIEREMEAQESIIFADDKDVANYVPSYIEREKKALIMPEDYAGEDSEDI